MYAHINDFFDDALNKCGAKTSGAYQSNHLCFLGATLLEIQCITEINDDFSVKLYYVICYNFCNIKNAN